MNKELEEAIRQLTYLSDYGLSHIISENNIKQFKIIINYIENSIPKEVVLEKLEKKKDEREEYWEKDEIMLNFVHDEKRAEISIEELKINNKNVELLGEIKCLQELLEEKERNNGVK